MVLITGGKYQGKREFAVNILKIPQEKIIDDLNEKVMERVRAENMSGELIESVRAESVSEELIESVRAESTPEELIEGIPEDSAVIIDETGCGIIPVDPVERKYREKMGRIGILLSERAESVYRVAAGLGIKLK